VTVSGTTLGALAQAIDDDSANSLGTSSIDLSATANGSGLTVVSQDATSVLSNVSATLVDKYGSISSAQGGSAATSATNASAIVGTGGTIGTSDVLTGILVLSNGGANQTFTMGALQNGGTNILTLASAISQSSLGLNATVVNGALELQSTVSDTSIVMGGASTLKDTATEQILTPGTGAAASASTTTLTLGSGVIGGTDVLTGSITLQANASGPITFVMSKAPTQGGNPVAQGSTGSTINVNGNTLADLENAIESSIGITGLNITAAPSQSGTGVVLTSIENNAISISVTGNKLFDAFANPASSASLGSFASATDPVTGTISFNLGGSSPESLILEPDSTVSSMIQQINANNFAKGVTASLSAPDGDGFVTVTLTSNTYGSTGEIQGTSGTSITDTTTTVSLSYTAASAYSTGLASDSIASNAAVYDSSSGQGNTVADEATFISNAGASGGVATISYTDGAGQALNNTDLLNQTDAATALNNLNLAISDVASQDGYIGAQINTLQSISHVMSTQQENVVSAQNAIQATDYASATSNMSKYEILSQTGIAALAQANSVQQEVTKLLQ
jgi:flagellin